VLDQLRQTVEHLATVHVEFFVYVPEQKQEFICFLSILAIYSLILRFHNRKSFSGGGLTTGFKSQIDFCENNNFNFSPVLRIHKILVRIRIHASD
jgi:hypothetical protein